MKIFIFLLCFFGFFYVTYSIEIKNIDTKNIVTDIYHPIYQDYQYWTEYHKKKQILDTKSLSIKKYDFLKKDNINLKKELLIYDIEKLCLSFYKKNNRINDVFFSRKHIRYFDVKTPISEIFYIHDIFNKKILGGLFTHSPNKNINYSIEYKNVFFDKKFNNHFLITFNQWKENSYYKLWGHYLKNNLCNYTNNVNSFLDKKNINHERLYISFIKKIIPTYHHDDKKSIFFRNYIEYTKYFTNSLEKINELKNYQKNLFFYKNYNSLIFKKKKKYNIEVGFLYEKIYSQFFYNDFFHKKKFNNQTYNKKINVFTIVTKIHDIFNKKINFNFYKKWILDNKLRSTPLQINFQLDTNLYSNLHFLTKILIKKNIYSNFTNFLIFNKNGNFYNNTINNLLNFKSINFSFFSEKKLNISFKTSKINNINFFTTNNKLLNWNYINLWNLKIKNTNYINNFQFNNIILLQKQSSDNLIFYIPSFFYKSTISYKKTYFDKSLLIKTGCSINYLNQFFSKNFSYPFDLFSNNEYYGNHFLKKTFINYFLNFKIFRTNFYTSIQNIHFNKPFFHQDIFIRLGLFWNIFT
ncbi:hypothetical protein [Blattabacterium cuenoti]|uniref:hypothetical protein n=1 Tax=Blattabacterium cuenoti TaxID=1653831 RepID=UPI00163D3609|nr:hypothetical protein [Blattabacterium cuenoti]